MIKGWSPHLQARLLSTDRGSCFDNQMTNDQALMTSLSLIISFSAMLSLDTTQQPSLLNLLASLNISIHHEWSEFSCLNICYDWGDQEELEGGRNCHCSVIHALPTQAKTASCGFDKSLPLVAVAVRILLLPSILLWSTFIWNFNLVLKCVSLLLMLLAGWPGGLAVSHVSITSDASSGYSRPPSSHTSFPATLGAQVTFCDDYLIRKPIYSPSLDSGAPHPWVFAPVITDHNYRSNVARNSDFKQILDGIKPPRRL